MRVFFRCWVALAILVAVPSCSADVPPGELRIGMNINALRDWGTAFPFVDVFHASRPLDSEEGGGVTLDAHGWIQRLARGRVAVSPVLFDIAPGRVIAGDYVVRWRGKGKLAFDCASLRQGDGSHHRAVIHIDGKDDCGLYLKVLASDPADPVRDIRVTLPGGICRGQPFKTVSAADQCPSGQYLSFEAHADSILFNPAYLTYLRDFPVLRFMDAMETNSREHVQRTWRDRPSMQDATWQKRGWPVEVMVALANRVGADPWFTMPHAADDAYVRQFAQYVRQHLDGDRKVYIEYSNEVWNGIFPQHDYAVEQGRKLRLDRDEDVAGWKFYSRRSVEIFDIWSSVFGQQKDRLVRVMATQAVNDYMTRLLLDYQQAWKHVDALAVAAYFGGDAGAGDVDRVRKMSKDRFFAYLQKVEIPRIAKEYRMNAAIARKFGLSLIAYEGGQHLVGVGPAVDDARLTQRFMEANRDPRMESLYLAMYRAWKQVGGDLFMHYSGPGQYSKWGSWGIKEYLLQPEAQAPKYRATLKAMRGL